MHENVSHTVADRKKNFHQLLNEFLEFDQTGIPGWKAGGVVVANDFHYTNNIPNSRLLATWSPNGQCYYNNNTDLTTMFILGSEWNKSSLCDVISATFSGSVDNSSTSYISGNA